MRQVRLTCSECGAPLETVDSTADSLCPQCAKAPKPRVQQVQAEPAWDSGGSIRQRWAAPSVQKLNTLLESFEVDTMVSRGGMSAVYKAWQPNLDRWVAIKLLAFSPLENPTLAERFKQEAKVLANLKHPNIVTIHDIAQVDEYMYLVMEWVEGVQLHQFVRMHPGSIVLVLSIGIQICDALRQAHSLGVVHRDIKPRNILIQYPLDESLDELKLPPGVTPFRVKLVDFGLAHLMDGSREESRLTQTHEVLGTPYFIAPEQIKDGRKIDHRTDIYSVGVVLYELLTGDLPCGRFGPPSESSKADGRIDDIVMRCLEREPDKRYQGISELRSDLTAAIDALPQQISSAKSSAARTQKPRTKSIKTTSGLLAAVGVCVVFLILVIFWARPWVANPPLISDAEFSSISFDEVDMELPGGRESDASWGDYDGDGDWDLAIQGFTDDRTYYTHIYRNESGRLVMINADIPGMAEGFVAWGDVDSDGDLDLAVSGFSVKGALNRVYRNDNGVFVTHLPLEGVKLSDGLWIDVDNDDYLDLVVMGQKRNDLTQVYINRSDGTFKRGQLLDGAHLGAMAVADIDGDGDQDLVLAGKRSTGDKRLTRLYRNDDGQFVGIETVLVQVSHAALAWGDYDSDGDPDLILTGLTDAGAVTKLYRNDGPTIFAEVPTSIVDVRSGAVAWGDFDNDGDLDLALAGLLNDKGIVTKLYRNEGNGRFIDSGIELPGTSDGALAWSDFDSDGDLDLAVTGQTAQRRMTKIYRNGLISTVEAKASDSSSGGE